MAFDFNSITEVQLAKGSHASPEQGRCAMEMVSWLAGEPHSDKPACASAVIGAYVININDAMPDDVRNRLLKPMVPLIAGTFDPGREQARAEFLAMWAVNKIVPIVLRLHGLDELAARCETAEDLSEANAAANAAYVTAYAVHGATQAANAAYAAAYAAYAAHAAHAVYTDEIWQCALDGLRGAIALGRCDGFGIDPAPRHEALRKLVKA
jgi:hypothetical protein